MEWWQFFSPAFSAPEKIELDPSPCVINTEFAGTHCTGQGFYVNWCFCACLYIFFGTNYFPHLYYKKLKIEWMYLKLFFSTCYIPNSVGRCPPSCKGRHRHLIILGFFQHMIQSRCKSGRALRPELKSAWARFEDWNQHLRSQDWMNSKGIFFPIQLPFVGKGNGLLEFFKHIHSHHSDCCRTLALLRSLMSFRKSKLLGLLDVAKNPFHSYAGAGHMVTCYPSSGTTGCTTAAFPWKGEITPISPNLLNKLSFQRNCPTKPLKNRISHSGTKDWRDLSLKAEKNLSMTKISW